MEKYTVEITNAAITDLDVIYNYIANTLQAKDNAIAQYNRIMEAILTLEEFPYRYSLFDLEPERSPGIRRMIVDNYLVFYLIDSNKVIVTDIIFKSSNVHNKLQKRHL